jgi:hypothetical protein
MTSIKSTCKFPAMAILITKIEAIALASKISMACNFVISGNLPEAHCHKNVVDNRKIINNPSAPNRPKSL